MCASASHRLLVPAKDSTKQSGKTAGAGKSKNRSTR
jgi:hypothetical protein